jgi:CDP-glucose 4,6-dehydratase
LLDLSIYKGKKVLITGNTGFKGAWLTIWLLSVGAKVFGISKDVPTKPAMFEILKLHKQIQHYTEDVRCVKTMRKILAKVQPDFIFHMAAQAIVSVSYQEPLDTVGVNVMGTANILEALRQLEHACSVVIVTSDKCYARVDSNVAHIESDPLGGLDLYSASKAAAEIISKAYHQAFFTSGNIRMATARAGNVIGGGDWAKDRLVSDCYRAWCESKPVILRNPNALRPWQHVLDPLFGYLLLGAALHTNNLSGEQFNFGPTNNQVHTVEQLVMDLSIDWKLNDPQCVCAIKEEPTFKENQILLLNSNKAWALLKWCSRLSYHEAIKLTNEWYLGFYKQAANMEKLTLEQLNYFCRIN